MDPKIFRQRVLARETLVGTWLNLGSSIAAEIAAQSGLDWVLIDMEHGVGGHETLVHQLQASFRGDCASLVRIAINDPVRFKRVLDLGAYGVMVPWVGSAAEAEAAVAASRYLPRGIRGAASTTRATRFGQRPFLDCLARAHEETTTVIQIERASVLDEVEQIAAIDGVDVLFVGPLDLSVSMGMAQEYARPEFLHALQRVSDAAKANGKAAGILTMNSALAAMWKSMGYTFIAYGSDGAMVTQGMQAAVKLLK